MRIAIFGAGGLAKEILDIVMNFKFENIVFIDNKFYGFIWDYPIVNEKETYFLAKENYKFVIGIGDTKVRKKIKERFSDIEYINLIHPFAALGYKQRDEVERKKGNVIFAGVKISNSVKVGNFGIYYYNSTIGHDCIIEDFVTICPGANISGNVKVCEGAFIGANACVLQGDLANKKIIGRNSVVGAGAVVTKNVAENIMVKGIPAK